MIYYYDLLRQLAAQIKKTYIHKITAGNEYKKHWKADTHIHIISLTKL